MQPFIIKRFTTSYAKQTDRILLSAIDHDEQSALVQVHPQLLSQLLVKLCDWLDGTSVDLRGRKLDTETPILKRQAINIMAQTQARVNKVKSQVDPVTIPQKALVLTPKKLHLKRHSTGYLELQFEDTAQEITAIILMQQQIIRQWLDILCRHWIIAGWDTSVWPDWLLKTSLNPDKFQALH